MSCDPQDNKLQIVRLIESTGILDIYDLDNNDSIRFLVENANPGNTFVIRMQVKGQKSWVNITTLTGNASTIIKSDTYDFMQLECTVLDGTNVRLLASGFKDGE